MGEKFASRTIRRYPPSKCVASPLSHGDGQRGTAEEASDPGGIAWRGPGLIPPRPCALERPPSACTPSWRGGRTPPSPPDEPGGMPPPRAGVDRRSRIGRSCSPLWSGVSGRRPCRLPSPPGFDPAAVYEEVGGGWIEPPCGLEGGRILPEGEEAGNVGNGRLLAGRRSGSDPEGRVEDDGAADRQPSLPLLVDEGLIDAGDQIRREPVLQDDL